MRRGAGYGLDLAYGASPLPSLGMNVANLPDKNFCRCDEVAVILDVSRRTVHRWIEIGTLPAVRCGGSLRIRREDMERICREGVKTTKEN